MANLQATLRGQTLLDPSPLDCIRRANKLLWASTGPEKFASMFYGLLDSRSHQFRYVNAGQEVPLMITSGTSPVLLDKGGVALGVIDEFDFEEGLAHFEPGDLLVVVSDGITESMNASHELFGRERMQELLFNLRGCSAQTVLERIVAGVHSFVGETPQWDDMTIVVMRRMAEA